MNKLLRAREAAQFLGLSQQTLYKHFEEGKIPGYRMGKALRFDVMELKNFMRRPASASTENVIQTSTGTTGE